MSQESEYGPAKYITLGASRPWRPNLMRLHTQWRQGKLILCLGAGVSIPYGLPNWNDLVLSLLLRLDPPTGARGRESIGGWNKYYPQYRRALGEWMIQHFKFDPVRLARVFVDDKGLETKIQEELYAPLTQSPTAFHRRTSLDAVVDLIAARQPTGSRISSVITLNYDDLLEVKLREREIRCTPVFGPSPKVDGIPIYHVHGFIPRSGSFPKQDLVFTESAYHQVSSSSFHWSVKTIMRHLYAHSVLFVGVSMTDPNLRRFLDAAHGDGEDPRHFAIRSDFHVPDSELGSVMGDVERRARQVAQEIGADEDKGPQQLREAIKDVCEKAHAYDKKTLKSLGVRPIWVRDNADVSRVLDVVRTGNPEAAN